MNNNFLDELNAPDKAGRLAALASLVEAAGAGEVDIPEPDGNVNNHIHTTYSFSPYSPTKAVWCARQAKLSVAGIIDHDSVGGVEEFREAGRLIGMPTTAGFEIRASFPGTPLSEKRLNNPDQAGIGYMTVHALAEGGVAAAAAFLAPVGEAREARNRVMCARMSRLAGIEVDYDRDVLPLSMKREGGSVTERHLLCALAKKMLARDGKPEGDVYALFDLIGQLKAEFVERFYEPAGAGECPDVRQLVRFCQEQDAYLAYAYLGDVTASVTGDKKAQAFEDAYLDELFAALDALGVRAISYMPARNTREQLVRVRGLCEKWGMLQISGEDINSPRQPFISEASKDPYFKNLKETTWQLVRHEQRRQP
ncbi:MAG: PHP domain-containing protein [Clostridiales Family XIII bacterium]|jgi:hypothetical protein|nr:PHP domain-containing protein [Clostridiales Family XIII bacterium]